MGSFQDMLASKFENTSFIHFLSWFFIANLFVF
jgi:hypothetical protein